MDKKTTKIKPEVDVENSEPQYDPHIVPAETAARIDREGNTFRTTPTEERAENAPTDDETNPSSIDTTGGYTVDKEGLLNNYAIEPEMYVNTPGDLRQDEEELAAERDEEIANFNEDEQGKLTMEDDRRGKGPGLV